MRNPKKKLACQKQETVERETVLCDGHGADDEVRSKVVSPHSLKELGDTVRGLEEDNKKVDRQNRGLAD